jgi:hypothetical protein
MCPFQESERLFSSTKTSVCMPTMVGSVCEFAQQLLLASHQLAAPEELRKLESGDAERMHSFRFELLFTCGNKNVPRSLDVLKRDNNNAVVRCGSCRALVYDWSCLWSGGNSVSSVPQVSSGTGSFLRLALGRITLLHCNWGFNSSSEAVVYFRFYLSLEVP